MLKTVAVTSNRKTGPIATTYRSGVHETYGTCPRSCSLHPKSETGTALVDTEVGGVAIRQGQRVGLFYSSANYDEEVFTDPFRFDILRNPNPHLAFGGNGAHFCIGANLARMEIKLMFNEIADQIPDISKLAEPQRLRSGWINGVKELQVSYS